MAIRVRTPPPPPPRDHAFAVDGSPVSVNRYGTPAYRDWRASVYAASTATATWSLSLYSSARAVRVRYFRYGDTAKDVDNILKAILDACDGKGAPPGSTRQVITNDRLFEYVASQRTDLKLHTQINGRSCHRKELIAMVRARRHGAAVFVMISPPPDHLTGMMR